MIIVCDIDNCLNNLGERMLEVYNARSGKNIQMQDITSYNFAECLPKSDADGICSLFKEKELWDSLKPLSGARETLKKLIQQGHRIYLATATDPVNFEWKCSWIKTFYPFIPVDHIIRIMDKSLLRVDVMIDDHMDNLIGNVCERICLDYPYNRSSSKDYAYSIYRVYNWSEVATAIENIERKNKEWERQ